MMPVTCREADSSQQSSQLTLRQLIAEDLAVNTGRSGVYAAVVSLVSDPAFSAVCLHRLVCSLRSAGWVFLSKLLWRLNVVLTGCHIHPEARIGRALRLPHPTGIAIGVRACIGDHVTIYQNVTLGRGLRDGRYPIIEDGATIFPNSVVSGGVTVGRNSIVGAGSIVIRDVPEGAVVTGNPARVVPAVPPDASQRPP